MSFTTRSTGSLIPVALIGCAACAEEGSSMPPSNSPPLGNDAGSAAAIPAEPASRAAFCPSVFDGRADALALLATNGETAEFVLSHGARVELPFEARSAMEVWTNRHFALFSPGTSWDLAVLSRDGEESYHASGAFSQFHDSFRTREVSLAGDGALTADYEFEGHDFTSAGPVRDLVVSPEGAPREVVIAKVDDEGYTPFAYGLAHVERGELLELPDRGAAVVHVERDGRWLAAQLQSAGGALELVVLSAAETETYALGSDPGTPARLVPVGSDALVVLRQLGSSVPLLQFAFATERVTPLVSPSESEGLSGVEDGTSYVLRDGSDLALRFLVDAETAITVDVEELALSLGTTAVTGARSWFLVDPGAPVTKIDRETGDVSALLDSAVDQVLAVADRLFLVEGGSLSLGVDLSTDELLPLATGDVSVDELVSVGGWVVGLYDGLPVLRLAPGSTNGEPLDAPRGNDVSHDAKGDWLVFLAAGRPLWAMSSDGATSSFRATDRRVLDPADFIDVQGDWAFGFRVGDDTTAGMGTIVWRANLREGLVEGIPRTHGYDFLFDPRYRLPGAEDRAVESFAMQATDLGHADGTVTAVRRDAASSFVLVYGFDATWRLLGDAMPGEFNLEVTAGNGFYLVERGSWDCFCPPPEFSWEASDAAPAALRQLVLTSREPFELLRQERDDEGSVVLDRTQSCVAWNGPSGSLVVDGPTGERVELGSTGSFRWLEPP